MASPKKSWGHRIHKLVTSVRCSVPGCGQPGDYRLSFFVGRDKTRTLHYCIAHALTYAESVGLYVPGELEYVNLTKYPASELQTLKSRIEAEISRRDRPDRLSFYFEAVGAAEGSGSAYAALLYFRDGKLNRYFYDFRKEEKENGQIKKLGRYSCKIGDIIEKRFETSEGLQWRWYLVMGEDTEIPVADYSDEKRKQAVIAYLQGFVPKEALLS